MKRKFAWLQRLPVVLGIVFSVAILMGIYLLRQQFQKPPHAKKVVQQLTMIQPPPPPPLTEQTKQEPELKQEEVAEALPEKEPEPAPEPADEPPLGELGLDADGAAGADGFGLAGRKGGRSILGGNGGNAILWYGGQIKNHLEEGLQSLLENTPAMRSGYQVIIEVWVDADGRISRSDLTAGSGKDEVDRAIRTALTKLNIDIGKPPPENMPQPVRIRLASRV
jgi:TonB family protein